MSVSDDETAVDEGRPWLWVGLTLALLVAVLLYFASIGPPPASPDATPTASPLTPLPGSLQDRNRSSGSGLVH